MRSRKRGRRSVGRKLRHWRGERRRTERVPKTEDKQDPLRWIKDQRLICVSQPWRFPLYPTTQLLFHTHTHSHIYTQNIPREHLLDALYFQQLSLSTQNSLRSPTCSTVWVRGLLCTLKPFNICRSLITHTHTHNTGSTAGLWFLLINTETTCSSFSVLQCSEIVASYREIVRQLYEIANISCGADWPLCKRLPIYAINSWWIYWSRTLLRKWNPHRVSNASQCGATCVFINLFLSCRQK